MAKSELGYLSKQTKDNIVAAVHDDFPVLRRIRVAEVAPGDLVFEIDPYSEAIRRDVLASAEPLLPAGCHAGVVLWREKAKIDKSAKACKPAKRGLQPEATPKTRTRKAPVRKQGKLDPADVVPKCMREIAEMLPSPDKCAEIRGRVLTAMIGEINAAFSRLGFKFEVTKVEVHEAPMRSVFGGCDVVLRCVGKRAQ